MSTVAQYPYVLTGEYMIGAHTPEECLRKTIHYLRRQVETFAEIDGDRNAIGDGYFVIYYAFQVVMNPVNAASWRGEEAA